MLRTTQISILLLVTTVLALAWSPAMGDPLDGQILKFQQQPMIATMIGGGAAGGDGTVYYGHDELSTAWNMSGTSMYQGFAMADDFADEFNTPVVHVRWWGSYLNEQQYPDGLPMARRFLISFESDIPQSDTNPFSHPGSPMLTQVVNLVPAGPLAPGSGTYTEKVIRGPDPLLGESLYEYNAELACPFPQEKDTVYWLKIVALDDMTDPDNMVQWGWHNRDYTIFDPFASTMPAVTPGEHDDGPLSTGESVWHFQDDSVRSDVFAQQLGPDDCDWGVQQDNYMPQHYVPPYDGPSEIADYSKDLAFELYTIPEPSTLILMGMGLLGLVCYAWRRHTR